MIIVGVGAGPGMLTEEAIEAIARAGAIYGSKRAIDLAREHLPPGCPVTLIEDYKKLRELPESAVVLSTGDPMLGGLGYLEGSVIPGISSLAVACARLKISQLKVVPLTYHGRALDPDAVAWELRRGKCVFLLIDEEIDLPALCRYLEAQGLSRGLAVLSDLGYLQERIVLGGTKQPPEAPGLSCLMIGDLPRRQAGKD
jgi:cobalt-precorrin-7 (C5)-methyltransferase